MTWCHRISSCIFNIKIPKRQLWFRAISEVLNKKSIQWTFWIFSLGFSRLHNTEDGHMPWESWNPAEKLWLHQHLELVWTLVRSPRVCYLDSLIHPFHSMYLMLDFRHFVLGWYKSHGVFALLGFAIRYWNTFLSKCGYVIHHFKAHFLFYVFC